MKETKYLSAFQKAATEAQPDFQLIGDLLIVEVIKEEETKTKYGIVVPDNVSERQRNGIFADKPTFARVLMVGEGWYNDNDVEEGTTPEMISCNCRPGDIVLVPATAIKYFSKFGSLISYGETTQIGLCNDSAVQMRFPGQESFDRFFGSLNRALEVSLEQK